MFGSNPTPDSRWTQTTGAQADIATVGYVEDGHWSVSCNQDRIGPGTVAIFARSGAGGLPPLAGFMVCTDDPVEYDVLNVDGDVETQWYVEGRIHGWPEDLWVQGSAIEAAGWPVTRSPWGTNAVRQFRNGEQLTPDLVKVILSTMPKSLVRMIALEAKEVTRAYPWWC
jgi:hypothetical protein